MVVMMMITTMIGEDDNNYNKVVAVVVVVDDNDDSDRDDDDDSDDEDDDDHEEEEDNGYLIVLEFLRSTGINGIVSGNTLTGPTIFSLAELKKWIGRRRSEKISKFQKSVAIPIHFLDEVWFELRHDVRDEPWDQKTNHWGGLHLTLEKKKYRIREVIGYYLGEFVLIVHHESHSTWFV